MHFDRIPKAETAQRYFETAMTRGRVAASRVKKIKDPVILTKAKERDRLRAVRDSLVKAVKHVHDAYPSFDHLHEFTIQVFKLDMDPGRVKQALGGLQHVILTIKGIATDQLKGVTMAKDIPTAKRASKAFFGRVASILRQAERHLLVLNEARTVFRQLPVLDDSLFTIAIAGFPNVGKSTLLRKLTSAEPEVQPYAFTTKGLNVGYFEWKFNKMQCIDTPGTLNRSRMNAIEKKADLVNRYLAHLIVYVFDPTECYALEKQIALYETLRELDKPLVIYISKTDIASKEAVAAITGKYPECFCDAEKLKKGIVLEFKKWV